MVIVRVGRRVTGTERWRSRIRIEIEERTVIEHVLPGDRRSRGNRQHTTQSVTMLLIARVRLGTLNPQTGTMKVITDCDELERAGAAHTHGRTW